MISADKIAKALNSVVGMFLDFFDAFDTVHHNIVLQKNG